MQEKYFKNQSSSKSKKNGIAGVVPKIEKYINNVVGVVENVIAPRFRLRSFISETTYILLVKQVVQFNDGIELKNFGALDSIQVENMDINIMLLHHIKEHHTVSHCMEALQMQYINSSKPRAFLRPNLDRDVLSMCLLRKMGNYGPTEGGGVIKLVTSTKLKHFYEQEKSRD